MLKQAFHTLHHLKFGLSVMFTNVIVCFVDFSKAFDMVNRTILFYKIKKLGICGRLIDTLYSIYTKTSFRVKLNGRFSDKIYENIGVNQGGNASPILFRKYLQDLITYLDKYTGTHIDDKIVLHRLWADDLFLISTNENHAQSQLNGLSKFCSPNQMLVNNIKTKFMVFGKPLKVNLTYNDKPIEEVSSYKCLGIIVNKITAYRSDMF